MKRYDTPSWVEAFTTGVEEFPLSVETLGLPRQTHTDHVRWMDEAGRPAATDAVITRVPGLWLGVKTADCIPVLLYDERQRLVAAVHAGWRGTVKRIVEETIREMGSQGCDLHAIIGPGISADAFEVGDEVYEAFRQAGFPMERIAHKREKWHLDLWQANAWALEQAGVKDIFIDGTCTFSSPDFYSARRDTINTGRNMNCIRIVNENENETLRYENP